jgi:AAA15 family ATPase/GTPase
MKNIKSLRIRNLRSFGHDNDFIPLKKLNLLVGRNSSGKSTFLRTFPLLRQSAEADTRSPILWYGSFVDFGDLNTAVKAGSDEVMFDFRLSLRLDDDIDYWDQIFQSGIVRKEVKEVYEYDIGFTLTIKKGKDLESINHISIQIENIKVEIVYTGKAVTIVKINVDERLVFEGFQGAVISDKGSLIPTDFVAEEARRAWPPLVARHRFKEEFATYIQSLHHQNKKMESVVSALTDLTFFPRSKVHGVLKKTFIGDKKFISNLANMKEEIVDTSFAWLVGINLSKILTSIDQALTSFYSGVRYLGPVRASAERFYRYQDLQVAQIDHTGSNLPMVLNSLGDLDKRSLNNWISENFDFKLEITNTGSHYAIRIQDAGSLEYYNVSDMGFGYSQLLPIIVSIWLESERIKMRGLTFGERNSQLVFAIEQPELHLHPHMQHKFGKAIAQIANLKDENDFCFIVETHSKHIIDAIGESIEDRIINKEDVNVSLFERSAEGITTTLSSSFDNEGYLEVWPAGFLSP